MMTLMSKRRAIANLDGYFEKIGRLYGRDHDVKVRLGPVGTIPRANLATKEIWLPADVEFAGKNVMQIIEGFLDHEAAHIRAEHVFHGNERYSVFNSKAAHVGPARQHMLNIFEDVRIERDAAGCWPGVRENLRIKNECAIELHCREYERMQAAGEEPDQTSLFMRVLNTKLRMNKTPEWTPEPIRKMLTEFADIIEEAKAMWCPRDADRLAAKAHALLDSMASPDAPGDEGDDGNEDPSSDEGSSGSPGSKGAGTAVDILKNPKRSSADNEERDDDIPSTGSEEKHHDTAPTELGEGDGEGESSNAEDGGSSEGEESQEIAAQVLKGLEDCTAPDWDGSESWRVVTLELDEARAGGRTWHLPHPDAVLLDKIVKQEPDLARYNKARALAAPVISVLVRRLAMWLKAQIPTLALDQSEGDIDEDVLPYVVTGERRIFEQERPGVRLDAAWTILIDQSGSMGCGDFRTHRSYWARPAAIALGEALHRCGIPFEMWGWDTDSQRPGHFVCDGVHTRMGAQRHFQYKTFVERWPRVRKRCGRITGYCQNDDVSAIYFVARRLIVRREKHKVLLVLTDGQPSHTGTMRGFPRGWKEKQLRDALIRVRRAGIADIGVGIESDYVKWFYNDWLVIKDLSTFAARLVQLVRKTIRTS